MEYLIYCENLHTINKFTLKSADDQFFCDIKCSGSFLNPYEYEAEDNQGNRYSCISSGYPLFRAQSISLNGEVIAKRKGRVITRGSDELWYVIASGSGRKFFKNGHSAADVYTRADRSFDPEAMMMWEVESQIESFLFASCMILDAQYPLSRIYNS